MANQRKFDTPGAIFRRLLEGCGAGAGADYKPYQEVRDFFSLGRRLRCRSIKFNRTLHYFSNLETSGGYLAEWSREVVGLREQFPLFPLSETEEIAKTLGVKHPTSPRTRCHVVMTTDQVWTLRLDDGTTREVAVTCKYAADRERPRNQEKRLIEEIYHARHGRALVDFDEGSVSKAFTINWGFIRVFLDPTNADEARDELAKRIDQDFRSWAQEASPRQRDLIARISATTGAPAPDAIAALYSLIAHRVWDLDIFAGRLGPNFICRFR